METKEIVNHLSEFLNNLNDMNREQFLTEMRNLHPTLQQIFAGHVMAWLNDYAANYRPDDRNRISIEYSRKILDALRNETGEEKFREHFPMI